MGRVDNKIDSAHRRIDTLKKSGYNINKEMGDT